MRMVRNRTFAHIVLGNDPPAAFEVDRAPDRCCGMRPAVVDSLHDLPAGGNLEGNDDVPAWIPAGEALAAEGTPFAQDVAPIEERIGVLAPEHSAHVAGTQVGRVVQQGDTYPPRLRLTGFLAHEALVHPVVFGTWVGDKQGL